MSIASEDLDEALLRQSVGSQQSRRLTEEERRIVAYHEAGHALCRRLCGLDPPDILSIVPRGLVLGFVAHSSSEDRSQELAHLAYARARQPMQLNRPCLDDLAGSALEHETLTREDLDEIFDAHNLRRSLLPEESSPRRVG